MDGAPASPPIPATAEPATPRAYSHAEILRVVSGVMVCILLAALDQTVVIPAVPSIAADLSAFGHLSWIVTSYLLTSTAVTPIYGKLSDTYGRRALLLPCIGAFIVTSVLCAVSQSLWQLILFRSLQGLGGGGLLALAQAAIADVVSPRERGRYQGYMAAMWAIASIAGPLVGGWLCDQFSWRWIFWINLPLGALAFLLCWRGLRIPKPTGRRARVDVAGAAMLTVLITGILIMVGDADAGASITLAWSVPALLALGAAFLWQELRAADPVLPPSLFRSRVFSLGVLIGALVSAGMFAAIFLLPLVFQLLHGANAATSGTLLVPLLGASVVGAYGSGQLARRIGRTKSLLLVGLAVSTAGFTLLAAGVRGGNQVTDIATMVVLGCGLGACMPICLVTVQNSAAPHQLGAATASLLFIRSIGAAIGSTLAGAVVARRFAEGVATLRMGADMDLGALHPGGAAAFDPAILIAARTALEGGFLIAFSGGAALQAVALVACLFMPDVKLRSSASGAPRTSAPSQVA